MAKKDEHINIEFSFCDERQEDTEQIFPILFGINTYTQMIWLELIQSSAYTGYHSRTANCDLEGKKYG